MHAQPPLNDSATWAFDRHAAGFAFEKPQGWRVSSSGPGEIEISDACGTAAAMVRARQVPWRGDLTQWLRLRYPASETGLHNVLMLRADKLGPHAARASFDYGSQVFRGHASVVALRRQTLATLYIAAAARAEFVQRLPVLTRILGSLRLADANVAFEGTSLSMGSPDLPRLLSFEPGVGLVKAQLRV